MRKRTTIKDVAAATGVSAAAVSAALSGKGGASIRVSAETRDKILAAAETLKYVPDRRSRSLRERRSDIITVITYEKVFPVDWRNEFYGFFVGIEEEAARRGYDILILNNRPDLAPETSGRIDQLGIADGAVVIGISKDEDSLARFMHSGFPIFFVGRREIAGIEPNYATFDYASPIVELAARTRAAGLTGVDFLPCGSGEPLRDKRRFLVEALEAEGLAFRELRTEFDPDAVMRIADAAAAEGRVLAFNGMALADSFLRAAAPIGPAIGSRFDAVVLEDRWQDGEGFWTRLDSDRVLLGKTAVACLVDIMSEDPIEPIRRLIPVRLVAGASSPRLYPAG
jgi:DNA-binding LacI/PurR family transcriptional regulator